MNRWIKGLTLAGLVAISASACEEDITGFSDLELAALRAEVALVTADGIFQDISILQDPGLQGLGFGGVGMRGIPGGSGIEANPGQGGQCQGQGQGQGQGSWRCQGMQRDGFTIDRTVTFYNDSGGVMEAFVEGETDKIHMVVNASGTIERAFWSASIVRFRDMTVEGLTTDLHTTSGTKTEEVLRSGNPQDGVERTFAMNGSATVAGLVHGVPRSEYPYPLEGTVTRQIHVVVTENGELKGERDVTAVITFDGTQFATMTVDGETFQIDLSKRRVMGRFGPHHN